MKGILIKNYAKLLYPMIAGRYPLSDADFPENGKKGWEIAGAHRWYFVERK
jgi:hypothetical protein